MKRQTAIILTILFATLLSCKSTDDRKFPEVKKLSEFKETDFVPTLENKIANDRNAVYCVTLLDAWDEVRKAIKVPLTIDKQFKDLTLLNNSKTFIDVLNSGEYTASGEVNGELIFARAEFKKSLPFEFKLESFDDELTFNKSKVNSFGVFGDNEELSKIVKVAYYKNDDNFIIKILPEDKNHELILFKSVRNFSSMKEMITEINKQIKVGEIEKKKEKSSWKYYLNDNDEVVIPKFSFNIETNYESLEGGRFQADSVNFKIETAWQRTAFILDEYGAEIESEAVFETSTDAEVDEELPKPKKMRFDKPFFLILRKTESKIPYFGLWITNTELMKTK